MIRQWPLVGRSEELEVIADATRAGAERARGIVLSGSAGVGKTRVARESRRRLRVTEHTPALDRRHGFGPRRPAGRIRGRRQRFRS